MSCPSPLPPRRVAVLGGCPRRDGPWRDLGDPVFFRSARDGGNGELRRLVAALQAGRIVAVVIRPRWNGHAATERVRELCRKRAIPVIWEA